ncbi:MAG: electron transport complex subunit E [Clostridia bacterium]|nr:electron transport complex subunit E [Clostridia bacterium]
MKTRDVAVNGLIKENAVFRMLLGLCSILALSNKAINGLGMGVAVTFVLVCSNVVISLLKRVVPNKVRIPCYVLVIATFVTVVELLIKYLSAKSSAIAQIGDAMGVFLPLIVVNCIILARAEAFASKNTVGASAIDGLFVGMGYTIGLTLLGIVRELLGSGSIFGLQILGGFRITFFSQPAGAFITYGLLICLFNITYEKIEQNNANRKRKASVTLSNQVTEEGAVNG